MTTLEREIDERGFDAVLDELASVTQGARQARLDANAEHGEVLVWDALVERLEGAARAAHTLEDERRLERAA